MPDSVTVVATSAEIALFLVGLVALWRFVLSPAARAGSPPAPLPRWEVPLEKFVLFLLLVLCLPLCFGAAGGLILKHLALAGDAVTVFNGAAGQLGLLAGIALYRLVIDRTPGPRVTGGPGVFGSGLATFLIAMPVVTAVNLASQYLMEQAGWPVEKQDLIGMFAHADSPGLLVTLIILATITAPLTEEWIFRAGLFRYLRTRVPRGVALVLPGLLFAALHVNWKSLAGLASLPPLTLLAVIFSLAYERTGKIGTSMIAHALFNLNTIALIFSGVGL